jgi:predicted porin
MNRKILTLAVAAALVTPMASHADVKVSGLIQAEAVSWEPADGKKDAAVYRNDQSFETDNRSTFTNDSLGTVFNEGPNHIRFDLDEKLTNTLKAQARYDAAFNTSGNFNSSLIGEEAWIGLKGSNFHFRYGTLEGVYKSSQALIDPWTWTSLQARSTGGGMSGASYNAVYRVKDELPSTLSAEERKTKIKDLTGAEALPEPQDRYKYIVNSGAGTYGGDMGLTNDGFVEGSLELGVNFGGFSARVQGIVDDGSAMDGAGLLELRYTMPNRFTVWLAGAYTDFKDAANPITDTVDDIADKVGEDASDITDKAREETTTKDNDGFGNWKVGGVFHLGPMVKLGLQYEDAELGTFDNNPEGGKYILGSLEFTKGNISFGGWVSGYLSDIKESNKIMGPDGKLMDEDALSWALGAKYHFGKRTHVFGGYRQTDSDNDYRDENLFTLGIRHTF